MSKRSVSLVAALFAAGLMSASPAWADRGGRHFDRGGTRVDRGHAYGNGHRGGFPAWGVGLGLLAGTAILVAATQPRPVRVQSVPVYVPPAPALAAYSPPAAQWWYYCAQSASYYPYVNYCPSGWTKVPATPHQ